MVNSLRQLAECALELLDWWWLIVPRSVGPGAGVLAVRDQFRTQTVALSGMGVAPAGVSLSPVGPVAFAATPVGVGSAAQTVTLTNNGGLPLVIPERCGDGRLCDCGGRQQLRRDGGGVDCLHDAGCVYADGSGVAYGCAYCDG